MRLSGFLQRLRYFLERQFIRGAHCQLLVMVSLIGLISLVGGLLAFGTGGPGKDVLDEIWWAFLRLTDPGYLGDDEGVWRRIVSTVLTVSGYVVFMGALIAILNQWLGRQMRSLERGLTPVKLTHHIVVLGWTDRTLPLLRELWLAEGRVKRFLARAGGSGRLRLVVLAEELRPELPEAIRSDPVLGKHFNSVIIRSGSALNNEHLNRAACLGAAAIIVPAKTFAHAGGVSSDVETIKILLALNGQAVNAGSPFPYVVAEIQSPNKMNIAHRAYQGPLEVVAGDASISRLMVQNVRHPGLSAVYVELLSHSVGQNLYIHRNDKIAGQPVNQIRGRFTEACFCGVIRKTGGKFEAILNPPGDMVLEPDDALLLLAQNYDAALRFSPLPVEESDDDRLETAFDRSNISANESHKKNVLIVGWSRKVPQLLREFATYHDDEYFITIFSSRPVEERLLILKEEGVEIRDGLYKHIVAEVTSEREWRGIDLEIYDSILLMSSDRLDSGEEADARTIVGYLQLKALLKEKGHSPQLLLELSDPNNERLLGQKAGEVIISPLLLSHILVHVALHRELRVVIDDLFSAGGPEIIFRRVDDFGLTTGSTTFSALRQHAWNRGATALGIYRAPTQAAGNQWTLTLNPEHEERLPLGADDLLVLIETR